MIRTIHNALRPITISSKTIRSFLPTAFVNYILVIYTRNPTGTKSKAAIVN